MSPVGPLMADPATGKIAELISQDYLNQGSQPICGWLDVIHRNGIVYAGSTR